MYFFNAKKRLIGGALIGNIMEFYDFIIFAYLSSFITKNFFVLNTPLMATTLTFMVFASGYLTRPFGALLFGFIGDKYGRKAALIHSIVLITLSTCAIGLLPIYASAGIWAPILLTVCRLVQGFAVSGEQSGAVVYLTEIFGKHKDGFIGALVLASSYFGVLLGSLTCVLMTSYFSEPEMLSIGWRIPFLLSIPLGIISLILRLPSIESPEFQKNIHPQQRNNPLRIALTRYKSLSVNLIFLVMGLAVPIYLYTIYVPTYITTYNPGLGLNKTLIYSSLGLLFVSCFVPFAGKIADKIGSEVVMRLGLILSTLCGYPLFLGLSSGKPGIIFSALIIMGFVVSLIASSIFGVIIRTFPVEVRYTGISFVFNTAMSLFGGTTPLMALWLLTNFGDKAIPGAYMTVSGMVSLAALGWLKHKQLANVATLAEATSEEELVAL